MNKIDLLVWICVGLVGLEGIVLLLFKMFCPLTIIARKYSDSAKDNFDIFLPRDIVSGDFYWCSKIDGKIILAAIDCTGHGVPGAFMSIVCNRLLNVSVKEQVFENAALMLKYLHEQLLLILQKGIGEDVYVRDGMDLALCIINKKIFFGYFKFFKMFFI